MKKYLKNKNRLRYQKLFVELKIFNNFKNTAKENISQEFTLKNIDERRNYVVEEVEQNASVSKKHKKVCSALSSMEHFLILVLTISGGI